jgi:hypothetical protein
MEDATTNTAYSRCGGNVSKRRQRRNRRAPLIKPGDIYEDCAYHPCVCLAAESIVYDGGWRGFLHLVRDVDLTGVSLWDLSVRSCSAWHCGVVPLNPVELLKSLYYHAEDKGMYEWGALQESIQQMKDGTLAAEYVPFTEGS